MAETKRKVVRIPKLKGVKHCSACGSTEPHHLAFVAKTGKCVV